MIESVFKRGANDRTLSFQTISEETRLPIGEVEYLVMKALRWVVSELPPLDTPILTILLSGSLKLIKGSMDQVDQKAYINWVQPRVLSTEQIGQLAERLVEWGQKLHKVEERIAPEVLVNS